jgi:hypothetical protein
MPAFRIPEHLNSVILGVAWLVFSLLIILFSVSLIFGS